MRIASRASLLCAVALLVQAGAAAAEPLNRVTILYDAFGTAPAFAKDWGFAALVEYGGRRILFDTGNDAELFAHNVDAAGVDLTRLDFAVISHRHLDHAAGVEHLLARNPDVRIYVPKEPFGAFGSSLPSAFYRKDDGLPAAMRYFDGEPPETMRFGTAWPRGRFERIDRTIEVAPGIHIVALVSERAGTRELRELSLVIATPAGAVVIAGCAHAGIENIVAAAAAIDPRVHLVFGGFHLPAADDDEITRVAGVLHDTFKVQRLAPGHCTGEPAFARFSRLWGPDYTYAGVGSVIPLP
jgi:7,8-dihydropterin-6-yl-methyl-4-(beta-D-ribofuranosyl)aminobenzene 5'-phosphate synthase